MTVAAHEVSRFRAMDCEIAVAGADRAAVAAIFARYDLAFSRFRPRSELSRVNASRQSELTVSPLFASALTAALAAAEETAGLVEPTVGAALAASGYDRDFASLGDDPGPPGPPEPGRLGELRLEGLSLRRPPGLVLDLNGVVKALAVDDAVRFVRSEGFVSAGGDLAVRGGVDVALPEGGAIRVVRGGLATSGSTGRAWCRGGVRQHHLIDPRTGRPSRSAWLEVTVSGATCLAADVAAKAAFLLGDDGPDWLDERGLPGRFVGRHGLVLENGCWSRAARTADACI